MQRTSSLLVLILVVCPVVCPGCDREARPAEEDRREPQPQTRAGERAAVLDAVRRGVAVLHPTEGNQARGTVRFHQEQDGVRVVVDLEGLGSPGQGSPGQDEPGGALHGFHVHEYGDCTAPDATSAGDHFDPEDHPHELPPERPRHAGDMGNLRAEADGRARLDQRFDTFTLAGATNPVLGRAVIVHAQRDTGEGPTGEAGARLACGVIGVAPPE